MTRMTGQEQQHGTPRERPGGSLLFGYLCLLLGYLGLISIMVVAGVLIYRAGGVP